MRGHASPRLHEAIGALVMTEEGQTVMDQLSDVEFNPASAVKIITAYAALKKFGTDHRFNTDLLLDGNLNEETGVFTGDVYVQGADPDFERADAESLGQALLDKGVKQINGRLVVAPGFSYRANPDALSSARSLISILHKKHAGERVIVKHGAAVGLAPENTEKLTSLQSEPLYETLKQVLSFSINSKAEQIGRSVGGVHKLEELVEKEVGLPSGALKLASASGLGRSRVKPKDMMLILKSLRTELLASGKDFQDIFPVAGIDRGTLDERFTSSAERGSVVAKTGTLPGTDGGTSALVGMFRSQKEDSYFVIFCWQGSVVAFRHKQDELIRHLQLKQGGPKPFDYKLNQADGS
jgi:D-alanyl-D-alanine carboxypeptidase/D-alanyl-D-alanine-endopeptidase (penicillin-binding protein 4)